VSSDRQSSDRISELFLDSTNKPVTVSGKVTDPQGNPLVGANVKVKGSSIGTTTDNLGRFTLANLDADMVLEVSFVGHDVLENNQTFHFHKKRNNKHTHKIKHTQQKNDENSVTNLFFRCLLYNY
jgi:hypothetical protein